MPYQIHSCFSQLHWRTRPSFFLFESYVYKLSVHIHISIGDALNSRTTKAPSDLHIVMGCLLSNEEQDDSLPLSDALPRDIMMDFLSRVPSKSLTRFRCVSKSWCNLRSDSHFIVMHVNRVFKDQLILRDDKNFLYSLDFQNSTHRLIQIDHNRVRECTKFWGSCEGSLYLQRDSDELPLINRELTGLCIWNPSTKECKSIPCFRETRYLHVTYGFSYNRKMKSSEVVCIFNVRSSTGSKVFVYSLGNDSRKQLAGNIPYILCFPEHGVAAYGHLHWLAVTTGYDQRKVIAYKAEDENFMEVELPNLISEWMPMSIGDFHGKLCVFLTGFYSRETFSLWVMNMYVLKESWMKLFSFAKPTSLFYSDNFLLGLTKTSLVVTKGDHNSLILYDPISSYRYEIHHNPDVVQIISI